MDIQVIINGLNIKQYARQDGSVRFEKLNLTAPEQALLTTYDPDTAFVVYGTLAPNRVNYHVVESILGQWEPGVIRGQLVNKGWGAEQGYYGLSAASGWEPQEIPVWILFSPDLAAHWPRLDRFEGAEYGRILIAFELANGAVGIGHIYALNED